MPLNTAYYRQKLRDLQDELDAVDHISADTAQHPVSVGQLDRQTQRYRLEKALRRLDTGDYGYCVTCDAPIPPKRLELDPTLLTCASCLE
jgi:DnaK suppressor protein